MKHTVPQRHLAVDGRRAHWRRVTVFIVVIGFVVVPVLAALVSG